MQSRGSLLKQIEMLRKRNGKIQTEAKQAAIKAIAKDVAMLSELKGKKSWEEIQKLQKILENV